MPFEPKDYAFLALVIVVLIGYLVYARGRKRALGEAWSEVASRLDGTVSSASMGLNTDASHSLECTIDGVALSLNYHLVRSGDSSKHWTRLSATMPCAFSFQIGREGLLSKLRKGSDIQVGESEYDGAFAIQASDEAAFRTSCDKAFRSAHLEQGDVAIDVENDELNLRKPGLLTDVESTLALLEFGVLIVRTFSTK